MQLAEQQSAERVRAALAGMGLSRSEFRAALESVPRLERDNWLDLALGIGAVPEDGPELPRGCVPYVPCPVQEVLDAVRGAAIGEDDVFIDLGSGLGRTTLLVQLLTGAATIGLEIQPALVQGSRQLAQLLNRSR